MSFARSILSALALVAALPVAQANAQAQAYPNRPVTIVVPLAAGSGMDTLVRLYAEKLSESLGKPVVVENKPGAALMLAAQHVATSPPDGHTLVVSTSSAMAINPVLYKKVNYDHVKDFVPRLLETGGAPDHWTDLIRPAPSIHSGVGLEALLELFKVERARLAIVRGETGATVGLVTLQDVAEEIVGDLPEQFGTP